LKCGQIWKYDWRDRGVHADAAHTTIAIPLARFREMRKAMEKYKDAANANPLRRAGSTATDIRRACSSSRTACGAFTFCPQRLSSLTVATAVGLPTS
jgi:hypothetical protein